jgi:hypothetical protein
MSEQPVSALEDPVPPVDKPPRKNGSKNKTVIFVVAAIVVICCLCVGVIGLGFGGYYFFQNNSDIQSSIEEIGNALAETPSEVEVTQPTEEMPMQEEIPTEEEIESPTEAPVPSEPTSTQGLGISRDEMMQFVNQGGAFTFSEPIDLQGEEAVTGTHSSLCVASDCAAVTLLGPADNLLAVSVAVPMDPNDLMQATTAITLVMDVALKFTSDQTTVPQQIMTDLLGAHTTQKAFDNTFDDNGYTFTENYNPQTHIASLAIAK